MIRYIIKRLLLLIPIILAVTLIVFTLMELAPGTIIDSMVSDGMTAEDRAALESQYNLDKSMFYRFGLYVLNLIQGDLGRSQVTKLSVWSTYISRLPNTMLLAFSALIIGSAMAIPLGIFAARHAGTLADNAATTIALLGVSMPGFWLGLLLLLIFSLNLGWFPGGGFRHGVRSLVLPALTSATMLMATATRQTRSGMLEVLNSDFLRTARAKGVPEKAVVTKHALGNAMVPIVTTIGTSLGVQLAGSVVVEQVFSWPGVGRLTVEAVMNRDISLALGCIILTSIMIVLVQLIVDLLFAFFDPRIKSMYVTVKKKKTAESVKKTYPARQSQGLSTAVSQESEYTSPDMKCFDNPPLADNSYKNPYAAQSDWNQIGQSEFSCETTLSIIEEMKQNETAGNPFTADSPGFSDVDKGFSNADISSTSVQAASYETKQNTEKNSKVPDVSEIMSKYRKKSLFGDIIHRLRHNRGACAGLVILGAMIILFFISLFMDYNNAIAPNIRAASSPPSWQYPFGTDRMGRNLFLRVIYGTRYSMIIGFAGVALAAFFGVSLGAFAGYYGGKRESIIMRISEVIASIPGLLLGMVIMVVLGQNLRNLIIAVAVGGIPSFIRITRASILSVRSLEFVESAQAVGLSDLRIIFTQVLPNGMSPIIVTTTTHLGVSIVVAASLSFLGFGVPLPTPEWGALVSAGRDFARSMPWLMTFPGIFIILSVLAFNLLGDGLRDALDPKMKK